MRLDELTELHYITPIANLPSILRHGILSYNKAKRIHHDSIADNQIQDRRANVVVPGGKKLHDYANLYFHARNPMMYKRREQYREICVLRINPDVLNLPGVVITDGNASGDYVRFEYGSQGLMVVDKNMTFAEDWTDPDPIQYYRKKSAKCAEVLVPDKIAPNFIIGAYVACEEAKSTLQGLVQNIDVEINSYLFFR